MVGRTTAACAPDAPTGCLACGVEILLWLVPAVVVTVVAMLWARLGRPPAAATTGPAAEGGRPRALRQGDRQGAPGARPPRPAHGPRPQHRHRRTPLAAHVGEPRSAPPESGPGCRRLIIGERAAPMSRRTVSSVLVAAPGRCWLRRVLPPVPYVTMSPARRSTCSPRSRATRSSRSRARHLPDRGRPAADHGLGDQPGRRHQPPRGALGAGSTAPARSTPAT